MNKSKTAGGYLWCYEGDTVNIDNITIKERPVDRYTIDDKYLDSFLSIIDASKKTGINRSCIGSVCNNHRKTAGGYVWRFSVDKFDNTKEVKYAQN